MTAVVVTLALIGVALNVFAWWHVSLVVGAIAKQVGVPFEDCLDAPRHDLRPDVYGLSPFTPEQEARVRQLLADALPALIFAIEQRAAARVRRSLR